jgi:phosphoglycerate kinase
MRLRRLQDLEVAGKKIIVRLDLNVPIEKSRVSDDTRITASLPTVRYLMEKGAKVVLCSHLGRPKGAPEAKYSLEPVGEKIAELTGYEVIFSADYVDSPISSVAGQLKANQLILIENLRFHPGEEKNDSEFAKEIGQGFDFYVDDAFGAVHRAHASTVALAELFAPEKRAAGLLLEREVEALSLLMEKPERPYTVIMGGAKVSDKIGVMLNLINHCNTILVGGAMAYTFLKFKGVAIGNSRVEADKMDLVEKIYRNAEARKVQIVLPVDHIVASEFSELAKPVKTDSVDIPAGTMGLDIGEQTIKQFSQIIANSKTVLWNGPMGVFEWKQFSNGSFKIAEAVAANTHKTLVGGGDSVAALNLTGLTDKIWHVSTGGGASLEFLEGLALPGIKVLTK